MILCDVYKSLKRENLYLYVDKKVGLERVPEDLLQHFGEHQLALSFKLHEDRPLAKEDPKQVITNLAEHGYHLQLPPVE